MNICRERLDADDDLWLTGKLQLCFSETVYTVEEDVADSHFAYSLLSMMNSKELTKGQNAV